MPSYAVHLLVAAKAVTDVDHGSLTALADAMDGLQVAIIDFERNMPVLNGVVQESEQ